MLARLSRRRSRRPPRGLPQTAVELDDQAHRDRAAAASYSSATVRPWPLTTAGWSPVPRRGAPQVRARSRGAPGPGASGHLDPHQPLLQPAQLERKRDQPLLCPVVQVSLEPLPLLLAGVDDSRTGPRSSSRRALSSACRRAFSTAMPAAAVTAPATRARPRAAVVHQRRHVLTFRSMSVVARRGQPEDRRPALDVGVGLELGQPVRELERGIAKARARASRKSAGARIARGARRGDHRAQSARACRGGARSGTRLERGQRRERRPPDLGDPGPPNTAEPRRERDHQETAREGVHEQPERAA